jgi:hypothetical protein
MPLPGVLGEHYALLLSRARAFGFLVQSGRGDRLVGGDTHFLVQKSLVGLLDMDAAAYPKPFALRSGPLPAPSSSALVRLPFS